MNTSQLENYMKSDPYISKLYGGVVAVDQLPLLPSKPSVYIVNCDPIALPGSHWVVVYIDNVCEHFDSAGIKPRPDFEQYLVLQGSPYMYNNQRVQDFTSDTCGLFCLFYCYFRCRGYSFAAIMNMFSDYLMLNEVVVKAFFVSTVNM